MRLPCPFAARRFPATIDNGTRNADSDAVAALGTVRALVASNAFHHLGLAAWKARFPDAQIFAPAQSIGRASANPYHYKTGEALVRVRAADGLAWYVTDVIMNLRELPAHPIARFAFRVTGSAPGLRMNRIAPLFMVKDHVALRRWLRTEADRDPPRWLIPAHGDAVDLSATPTRLRDLFGSN